MYVWACVFMCAFDHAKQMLCNNEMAGEAKLDQLSGCVSSRSTAALLLLHVWTHIKKTSSTVSDFVEEVYMHVYLFLLRSSLHR